MSLDLTRWDATDENTPVICVAEALNGLGCSAWQSWAFRRADLTAFVEGPFRCDNGERATMAPLRMLEPGAMGVERMVPMGATVLQQLRPVLAQRPADARVALVLCLAERMAEGASSWFRWQRELLEHELLGHLAEAVGGDDDEVLLRTIAGGHAGFAQAAVEVGDAMASGRVDVAVLGAVDTWHDPAVIESLVEARRLYDGENLDTMIPGEGAAFLVVARVGVARRAGWPMLGRLLSAATAREIGHRGSDVPCMALGLTAAANAATERLRAAGAMLDAWYADMTAEQERVHEFQLAWPRCAAGLMAPTSSLEFLPNAFGDLGAATMPTAVAVALEGMARGDPAGATALVTGSSDGDLRGAVLVGKWG